MANLLYETIEKLAEYGNDLSDVVWFGCRDFEITSEQFVELANHNYDSGWGAPQVAEDLLVVGTDFWLERHEYDGAEWWEYKKMPQRPKQIKSVNRILGGVWSTLNELNEAESQTEREGE